MPISYILMLITADYQHSETGVTPLMAACSRGMTNAAEQLINLGANVHFRAIQAGCTALDIALRFHHDDCVDLLQTYMWVFCVIMSHDDANVDLCPVCICDCVA